MLLGAIALFAAVIAADRVFEAQPNRQPAPPAVAELEFERIDISAAELAPLALVGAWLLTSPQPRVGGISGLAIDGEHLVAITDSGAVLRFSKELRPRMQARIADLSSGPGDPRFKRNRDSEAILRDSQDRGWWVAFENREQLWLFDHGFTRALGRMAVPRGRLSENTGIEGLAGADGVIFAFPEKGGSALRLKNGRWARARIDRSTRISDAVQVGDATLLLHRRLTLKGFDNALALARRDGGAFRTIWRKRLPVSWRDNFEAVAAERIAGGYRLWMMSDDNFHPPLRTVLLVVDVPAAALREPS